MLYDNWHWVRIADGWFPAVRSERAAGGWTNQDCWEDFNSEVEEFIGIESPLTKRGEIMTEDNKTGEERIVTDNPKFVLMHEIVTGLNGAIKQMGVLVEELRNMPDYMWYKIGDRECIKPVDEFTDEGEASE